VSAAEAQAEAGAPEAPAGGLDPACVPALPRGVRLHRDAVRGAEVLLGPERALMLDPAGHAILTAIDGRRDLAAIAADLAARFQAPEALILRDAGIFLADLAAKRLVDLRPANVDAGGVDAGVAAGADAGADMSARAEGPP